LLRNLSKFITQTGLYCSKQLETTFHQFCEKPLHITFKLQAIIFFENSLQLIAHFLLLAVKISPNKNDTV